MPQFVEFNLTDEEYESLLSVISKSKTYVREFRRAEILLLLHNQIKAHEIPYILGIGLSTAIRTRNNYLKSGLKEALHDSVRSGKPKKFSPTDRAKITALACTEPPEGYAKWSLSLLADRLVELKYVDSISKAQVGRILKKIK